MGFYTGVLGVDGGGVSWRCGAATSRTQGGSLTEGEGSKSSSGEEVRGIEDQAGPGGLSMVVEHGGQEDQALQGAGVGRRMGAGLAGQLLSEIDRALMCSSF